MLLKNNAGQSEDWMYKYRENLIQQVQNSRRICKALWVQDLISEGQYCSMMGADSSQDRMKQVLRLVEERGQRERDVLNLLLQEHEPELTLNIEQAMLVHTLKQRLVQRVKKVEPVAHRMLDEGLLKEPEYFQICEEDTKDRMEVMYQVLELHGLKQSAGFYSALFHCEPLLHRELEKERVLGQISDKELEEKKKEVDEERRRLDLIRSELQREREQLEEKKLDMERWWRTRGEINQELNTGGGWQNLNNNNNRRNTHESSEVPHP